MTEFRHEIAEEDLTLTWQTFGAPHTMPPVFAKAREDITADTARIEVRTGGPPPLW
jgi:hypothetical protein